MARAGIIPTLGPMGQAGDDHTSHDTTLLDVDEIAPWDGRRVPVTLIGGYLGAGKTTVVNQLLARTDRPIAVFVNDVGQIAVDHALIARRSSDAVELTDGCICCSLQTGLTHAFDQLRARPEPPDHLLIELSGVADPSQVLPWAGSNGFRLDSVVVLVDAEQIADQLADSRIGPLIRRQLACADLAIVTKLDLCPADAAPTVIELVRPETPDAVVLPSTDAGAVAAILDTATRRPGGVAETPPPTLFDPHQVTTVPLPDPTTADEVQALLDRLAPDVVRAKGVARTADGQRLLIQLAGRRRSVAPLPAAEDQPPTDLVVISLPG